MYEENIENLEDSVEEEGGQEELPEPAAGVPGSDGARNTDDIIADGELLNHCSCTVVEGHIQWRCDRELYRDRLVDLLRSKQVVELDTNWSLDEGSFL